jgi:hypothetical protein
LIYLKALLEKPFQTLFYSLKNSFEKIRFQNTILNLFKPMQACLQKKFYKWFILNEVALPKTYLKTKLL